MKTTPSRRLFLALTAAGLALPQAQAETIYWDGTGTSWNTISSWSTDTLGATDPSAIPGASDDVVFNIPGYNTALLVSMGSEHQFAQSLTFNSTGTVRIGNGGGNRDLTIGSGGVTLALGGGSAQLGDATNNNNVYVRLGASQTWTNNSTAALTSRNTTTGIATGTAPVTLTMSTTSTGQISQSGGLNDGAAGAVVSLVVNSSGTGASNNSGGNYSGGTTVLAGVLTASGATPLGASTGAVVLGDTSGSALATLNINSGSVVANNITVRAGSSGIKSIGSNTTTVLNGSITLNDNLTLSSGSHTVNGTISGTGGIVKATTGTLTLAGNNTFSGGVSVLTNNLLRINNGGTSATNSALGTGTLSSTGSFTLDNTSGADVTLATNNAVVLNGTLSFTGTNNLNLGTGAFSLGTASGTTRTISTSGSSTLTIGGVISNGTTAFGLIKQGSGTLSLQGVNTYTGATQIGPSGQPGGVLEVTHLADGGEASSIGASSALATGLVFGGTGTAGTLRYIGFGDSTNRSFGIGSVGAQFDASGTGAINWTNTVAPNLVGSNTARTVTLTGTSTHANTMSAGFTNNGTGATSITKTGSGRWILSGANTYSGATTVSGGTLGLSGSIANSATTVEDTATFHLAGGTAGAVTVNSGAFLTGSGTVGNTSINGALAIGNSPGTLTLSDGASLTLGSGSVSDFEFTSSGFGLGSFDRVTGTANGSLETATLGGTLNLVFTGTGYTEGTDVARIFDLDSLTGTFTTVNVTGLEAYGLDAVFNSTTGYISLVGSTIPEPSAFAALAGFGVLVLAASRRRRAN